MMYSEGRSFRVFENWSNLLNWYQKSLPYLDNDALQDTYIKLSAISEGKRSWSERFFSVTYRNILYNSYRRENRYIPIAEDEHFQEMVEIKGENAINQVMRLFLQARNREIISLYLQGYTQTEIADIIGISQVAVNKRFQKIKAVILKKGINYFF